jgi:hypothetical protein
LGIFWGVCARGEYVSPSETVRYCVLTIVAYGLAENAVVIFVGQF